MTILEKIALALPAVESPARYMGGEANSVIKDHSKMLARMAFVFPDTYEIGMSNNGLRILYHVLNREPDLLCEVAFAPWDDMAAEMKKYDIPLYTHASYTAVPTCLNLRGFRHGKKTVPRATRLSFRAGLRWVTRNQSRISLTRS